MHKFLSIVSIGMLVLATLGCAPKNVVDPYEDLNRTTYSFNKAVDNVLLKPAARAYQAATPNPVRQGVSNFFTNLKEPTNMVNNILQGNGSDAVVDMKRFFLNSIVGVGGVFDIATSSGMEATEEDFGQTLRSAQPDDSPYLVLPILGPSTVDDALGRVVDNNFHPVTHIDHTATRNAFLIGGALDTRANLLDATDFAEEAALDEYTFIRDIYLERRAKMSLENEQ